MTIVLVSSVTAIVPVVVLTSCIVVTCSAGLVVSTREDNARTSSIFAASLMFLRMFTSAMIVPHQFCFSFKSFFNTLCQVLVLNHRLLK